MLRKSLFRAAALAGAALLPSLAFAQAEFYRPDFPDIGLLSVGPLDSSGSYAAILENQDAHPYVANLAGVQCVSPASPGTLFQAVAIRSDSIKHGSKKAKGSHQSGFEITATWNGLGATSVGPVFVGGCKLKWQVADGDLDHDYDGGLDVMKAQLSCSDDVATSIGFDPAIAAQFLEAFYGKLSCKVSGVPANTPGGACFRGDTIVATANGARAIREIAVGDLVWSRDESTGTDVLARVEKTFEHPGERLRDVVAGGETLHTTDEHPFRVDGKGWVKAIDLDVGDRLLARGSETLLVTSSRAVDSTAFYAGYSPSMTPRAARPGDLRFVPASLTSGSSALPLDTPASPTVYNIEVGTHHNYYVGSSRVLVHNK